MSVFYVGTEGVLAARSATVDARGDRIAEALALAAAAPARSGLESAIPADAFGSVSFDGVGAHGRFGVELADSSFVDDRPSMTAARARLAVRAAVCTVQNGIGAPVVFYFRGRPVDRLFGQPLRDGAVRDGHCPH